MEPVILQYSQEDRDMLRDTNRDVKTILESVKAHDARITALETWHIRVSAIVGFVGYLLGSLTNVLLRFAMTPKH